MQGVVWSCIACGVQCAIHQSMWRSFGDASEMYWKSMEFNMQGHTLTIPRHTGHFLRHLWALPDTKCRKGESTVHFPYTFIHVVYLETNIRNDLPGSNTMWNDTTSWEKPRGQHKRKTGDNKKGSNSNNFGFPFYFPSSKLCSLHTNKSS